MTTADLRFFWGLLAAPLALALLRSPRPVYWLVFVLPWLTGVWVVISSSRADRALSAWRAAAAADSVRRAAMVAAGMLALAALGLGPVAALAMAVWVFAAALTAAQWVSAPTLRVLSVNGVTAVGTIALTLGLLEGALRLPPFGTQFGTPRERELSAQYDDVRERNAFNFRTPHETFARRHGVRRVVALGDSFTFGVLLPNTAETWPSQYERGLSMARPDEIFEVVNLARPGFTTANNAEMLRRVGWQFEPELVLIQVLSNDVYPSAENFRSQGGNPPRLLPDALRTHSVALERVERAYRIIRGQRDPYGEIAARYVEGNEGWRQMRDAFAEMGRAATERRVPAAVLIYPDLVPGVWTSRTHPLRPVFDKVEAAARNANLEVIDLTEVFGKSGQDGRSWWTVPWDAHPGGRANQLVAETLVRETANRHWLPKAHGHDHGDARFQISISPSPTLAGNRSTR